MNLSDIFTVENLIIFISGIFSMVMLYFGAKSLMTEEDIKDEENN